MPKIPNSRCTRLWSTFTAKIPSSPPPVGFRMKPKTPTARNDTPNTKATALTITTPFVLLQPIDRVFPQRSSVRHLTPIPSNCPLRRLKTGLRMRAVAERLRRRTSAAAQRDGRPPGAELVAFGVEYFRGPLHQVRPVVQGSDLDFVHHYPPLSTATNAHLVFSLLRSIL